MKYLNFPFQELNLVNNPLKDNRLRKLCEQKGTKAVLDYIKAHSGKDGKGKGGGKGGKKGKKAGKQAEVDEEIDDEVEELNNTLRILSFSEDYPEIMVSDLVKEVTGNRKVQNFELLIIADIRSVPTLFVATSPTWT